MSSEVMHRLPRLCFPLRYVIEIKPCLKTFKFCGKESVALEILDGASALVLNAKNLTVNSAKFNGEPVEVLHRPECEQIHLPLGCKYHAGPATLDLEFSGEISDKMSGFYRISYTTDDESKKVMLATHFEVTWNAFLTP
ncbi:hypothetical protein FGIG_08037 [Fasciola gigantica]|uniref:Aminopeptidase N-like N-terminal domain-containing protein n=1 Tax=Fasciola gigantica TaxID=46835 RepID=A0A504YFS4_FASGI|nr:hypothetical protein FGIG_08037 [Fasciola gigantica]